MTYRPYIEAVGTGRVMRIAATVEIPLSLKGKGIRFNSGNGKRGLVVVH